VHTIKSKNRQVLYISYNGIDEPLVQSQVINYLRELHTKGNDFHLLTFEKNQHTAVEKRRIQDGLESQGIRWHSLNYHRKPRLLATTLDIVSGIALCRRIVRKNRIVLIHSRSFIAALIATFCKSRIPHLYDIRGFWVDEKSMKGSLAKNSWAYATGKWLESSVYRKSAGIVSLTFAAKSEIESFPVWQQYTRPPISVIPTCVDVGSYTSHPPLRQWSELTFGYTGSIGSGYLAREMVAFFKSAYESDVAKEFLIVTKSDTYDLKRTLREFKTEPGSVLIDSVEPEKIPSTLNRFDVGLCFIQPHYSKMASCPTKLGEYLAAGIPVVANSIGDVASIIREHRVGVVIDDFSKDGIADAMAELRELLTDQRLQQRCLAVADELFSLANGVNSYNCLYDEILC
jgi:glycosyltransferase involved in cell wall biosynthesis